MSELIFISHRTSDDDVADMLRDFLIKTGIPMDNIKCSSLPGSDVKEKISAEIRDWIASSVVNIAILSAGYYESVYCLNEAGILWYLKNIPVIPVALPEISPENMRGFIDGEYKLRRLDNDHDIAYIYDTVRERLGKRQASHTVITAASEKLKEQYRVYCENRGPYDRPKTGNAFKTGKAKVLRDNVTVSAGQAIRIPESGFDSRISKSNSCVINLLCEPSNDRPTKYKAINIFDGYVEIVVSEDIYNKRIGIEVSNY